MLAFIFSNNSSFTPHIPVPQFLKPVVDRSCFFRALNQTKKCGKIFFVLKREIVCRQSLQKILKENVIGN